MQAARPPLALFLALVLADPAVAEEPVCAGMVGGEVPRLVTGPDGLPALRIFTLRSECVDGKVHTFVSDSWNPGVERELEQLVIGDPGALERELDTRDRARSLITKPAR